jgi:hypothetical protein
MLGIAELGRACFGHRWRRATARALGISDKLLWRWERGLSKPAPCRLRHMLVAAAQHREEIEYHSKVGQAVLRRIREPGTSTYGGPHLDNRGFGTQKAGTLRGPGTYVLDMLPDPPAARNLAANWRHCRHIAENVMQPLSSPAAQAMAGGVRSGGGGSGG